MERETVMAASLPCDLCQDEAAVIMANNLMEPGALCVGVRCMASYGTGLAVGILTEMPEDDRKEYAGIVRPLAELCGIVKPKASKAKPQADVQVTHYEDLQLTGDGDGSGEPEVNVTCECCENMFTATEIADGVCAACAAGCDGGPCV